MARVALEALEDSIPLLRAAGVSAIDVDLGSVFDTIPAPAEGEPETVRDPSSGFPLEEAKSDRVAVAYGWIPDPSEPDVFAVAFGEVLPPESR